MSIQTKLRRGTLEEHSSFIGALGEVTVVTDNATLRVHDGVTLGGVAVTSSDNNTPVSFSDLTNTPTTLSGYGITDAFDGNYSSLSGAPVNVSELVNDAGYLTSFSSVSFTDLTDKPTTIAGYGITDAFDGAYSSLTGTPTLFSGSYTDLTDKPTLFSGSYTDLTDKPTIPTVPTTVSSFTNDAGYLTSVAFGDLTATPTTIAGYGITDAFDGAYSSLTGTPTLFSGSYTDLTDKPTIPTVPTNVSAFTNDSGYLTSYTETDPVFTASTAFGIDGTDVSNWNTAFGWGDHSTEGYLTTVTASDITASGITDGYVLTADGAGGVAWEEVSGGGGSTISGAVLNDGYTEEVSSLSGTSVTVSPDNGTIQTWSLTANSSWDVGTWGSGQTVSLIIEDNGYTLTNPILSTPISNPFGASAVADGSTHTLPTGSEGELVVLFVADDTTVTAPTGWTQVGSNYETASTADLGIFYKTIGTGETTVSLNQSTLASVSFIFGGDPEDLVFTNTATGASASPNPPSASMTEGNYSLVFGFMDDDNVTMSAPTGYTLIGSEYYPFDVALAVAYKLIDTTGTEDPSAFGNSGSDTWNAGTLELSGFDTTPIVKWQDGTEPTLGTGNTVQLEVLKVGSNYYGTAKEFS